MKSLPAIPAFPCRRLILCTALVLWLLAEIAAAAPPNPPPPNYPQETARLSVEGRMPGTIGISLAPAGPLFSLVPLTDALGVELVVGPLQESHRLVYPDKEIIVGPDRAVTVQIEEGKRQEPIVLFSQPPVKTESGLRVPLDFLELALGNELGVEFRWDDAARELNVRRREVRRLTVDLDVIHQRTSTVEVRFSEPPRYRVIREAGLLSIELLGDRIRLPLREERTDSPLLRDVLVSPQGLRFLLAEDASAGDPRLLGNSLVFDIFFQPALSASGAGEGEGDSNAKPYSFGQEPVGGVRTIVLDPGHGGDEAGAVGRNGTMEKDLTLLIARSLRRELHRRLPVRVILTRDEDVDVPLESRTAIANQNRADLFISLHFNSTYGAAAEGAETFFLSREASDQLAAQVAAAENAYSEDADDPETDLQMILWDLTQTYHLAESQRFANLVQEELNQALGIRNRGVKQAPFRVLMGAAMPAVLVELGFLNHPAEEARLQDPSYRRDLVDALLRAVTRFKTQIEARERLDDGSNLTEGLR